MKQIYDGVIVLAAGDALGVPAEFKSRAEIADDPVISIRGYGTHSASVMLVHGRMIPA
ncbi:hypothetical protein CBFG_00379 [Clostridiales bacterium 1_7_47FAA]|uniref:ADP-ribosylglycohydrolase family protein n=1 Tax=Enterocloster hominis (ex Hitch et al. 2024) TaxID=1917870 RepID=A0ABV1D6L7_9FIRM|nr:ADP-ribosylglycohydrolase family protein [Lachnoclostridium pacaense]EEQ56669.1 hypothetical protein CBFG_00379 [Clostridiales bacterium 1_7_47FAA]